MALAVVGQLVLLSYMPGLTHHQSTSSATPLDLQSKTLFYFDHKSMLYGVLLHRECYIKTVTADESTKLGNTQTLEKFEIELLEMALHEHHTKFTFGEVLSKSAGIAHICSAATEIFDMDQKSAPPRDCHDILMRGSMKSGVYAIHPGGLLHELHVYCDMTSEGGGWLPSHFVNTAMLTRSKCVASTGSDEGLSKIEPTTASKTKRKTSRTPLKQDIHRDRSPMRGVTKGTRHGKSEGSKKSESSALRKPKDIQDIPKITKVSHAIEGRSDNKVFVQWTSKKNVDHYIVFWNVQDELCQQKCTETKSILLEDISGMKPTDICVAASRQGQLSDQSPPVRVPTVTIPHMQFDDKRTGPDMRVSMDGKKITIPEMVTGFQALVHVIRGNTPMKTGRFYWEVEAVCLDDNCKFAFGGSLSTSTWDAYPGIINESWGILLNCNYNETTIEIQHDCHCQHREVYRSPSRPHTHRYGQLLDISTGSVTIIDVTNGTNLYTFKSVDTSNDVIPIFTIHWNNTIQTTKSFLRLLDPEEIQRESLVPIPVV